MSLTPASTRDTAGILIALGLIAAAGIIAWDLSQLQISSVYGLGPKAMPMVVAGGLALLGVLNLIAALRGGAEERERTDVAALLLILGGLGALMAVIALGGGFIPAVTILFAATATAFGRRAVLADLLIGFGLGLFAYLLFSKLLSLSLPMGPLERLL